MSKTYFSEQDLRDSTKWYSLTEQRNHEHLEAIAPLSTYIDVFLSYNIADFTAFARNYLDNEQFRTFINTKVFQQALAKV